MKKVLFIIITLCSFLTTWAQQREKQTANQKATEAIADTTSQTFAHNWLRYGYNNTFFPLHEGLNTTVSLSAMMGLGHNAPQGVGLGRSIDFTYASPLSKQLTYTLSANTIQTDWGGIHDQSIGIGGSLNCILSDRCSISIEGHKNIVSPSVTRRMYPHQHNYQSLGGAFNYKCGNNVFFQFSIDSSSKK